MADDSTRSYDQKLAALFSANYREAKRAARNIDTSLERTAHLLPLDGATLESLDDEARERLDAFRVRFGDLQDLLAGKTFRSLLMLEEEKAVSQLDVLNAMEKRGIITSFLEWKRLREIRNAFMHDYPEHANERAEALTLAASGARELLAVLDRLGKYAVNRIGISLPELPPKA